MRQGTKAWCQQTFPSPSSSLRRAAGTRAASRPYCSARYSRRRDGPEPDRDPATESAHRLGADPTDPPHDMEQVAERIRAVPEWVDRAASAGDMGALGRATATLSDGSRAEERKAATTPWPRLGGPGSTGASLDAVGRVSNGFVPAHRRSPESLQVERLADDLHFAGAGEVQDREPPDAD